MGAGGAVVEGGGGAEHQAAVGGDRDLGVAEVGRRRREKGGGFPRESIRGDQDADGAIGGSMGFAFAEDAEPAILEAKEVCECVVRGLVPDAADAEQPGGAGKAVRAGAKAKSQESGTEEGRREEGRSRHGRVSPDTHPKPQGRRKASLDLGLRVTEPWIGGRVREGAREDGGRRNRGIHWTGRPARGGAERGARSCACSGGSATGCTNPA